MQEAPTPAAYITHPFPAASTSRLGIRQSEGRSNMCELILAPVQCTAARLQAFDLQQTSEREAAMERLLGGSAATVVLSNKAAAAFPALVQNFGVP